MIVEQTVFNNYENAPSASKKKRAGFFENNIYVRPLRSREEMKELEHDMPEDIKDELLKYLEHR